MKEDIRDTKENRNLEENQASSQYIQKLNIGVSKHYLDNSFTFIWANTAFFTQLGYTEKDFLGSFPSLKEYGKSRATDLQPMINFFVNAYKDGHDSAEYQIFMPVNHNSSLWIKAVCTFVVTKNGDLPVAYILYNDINDTVVKQKKSDLKNKDSLTDLLNRAETERQIEHFILQSPKKKGALFMLDTDDFKLINDTKGHIVGDFVLAEIASGMKKIMRRNDIVGRIGGDEFIIFMKDIRSVEEAEKKAEDLLTMLRHLFDNEKSSVKVTCSIGVSIFPKNGRNFKELYAKADQALYQIKGQGKNNYCLYEDNIFEGLKYNNYLSSRSEIESKTINDNNTYNLMSFVIQALYQSENTDQTINMILEIIGKQFDVSRAYIFENSEDNLYSSNTFEWCNEGIDSEIANLQNLSFSKYGNYEQLFSEDSIFYCRDINALKPEQKELLSKQGIHSTLQCAILDEDILKGFIGFDECTGLRLWTQEEIYILTMVSQLLSIFLQRKKVNKIKSDLKNFTSILNNLDDCIYVIEKESNILLYKNSKFDLYFEYVIGQRCVIDCSELHKISFTWDQKEVYLCYYKI